MRTKTPKVSAKKAATETTSKTTARKPRAAATSTATKPAKVQAYADNNGLPPAAEQIVATERVAPERDKATVHLGFSAASLARIRRIAERRGVSLERYLMDAILEQTAYDFVDAAQEAGTLPATYRLDLPRVTFRHLESTAIQQGFRSLSEMLLHLATAYAWPSDRMTILGQWTDFNRWNQAAHAKGEPLSDWITSWLNTAAGSDLAENPTREANPYGATVYRRKSAPAACG